MSEEHTMITELTKQPPQKVKWKNVAYYDTFAEANAHRNRIEGLTKVRRCGEKGTKFVVKVGTALQSKPDEE
mgnify:CR=1 FL=1